MQRLFTLLLVFLLVQALSAQPCLTGWSFYQPIVVDNTGGDALTDFQLRIDLPLAPLIAAGKLRADASDLRVTDSLCQPLPFYVDSSLSSTTNTLWVRVPVVPSNGKLKLLVYYGNAQATTPAASGDDTFLFFDDFEADTIDRSKWEAVGVYQTWRQANGIMEYASNFNQATGARFKYVRTRAFFSGPVVMDFGIKQTNSAHFGFGSNRNPLERYLIRYFSGASDTLSIPGVLTDSVSNGYATVTNWPWLYSPRSQFQDMTVLARVNSADFLVIDEITNRTYATTVTDSFEFSYFPLDSISFILSSFSSSNVVGISYLKVRKPGISPAYQVLAEISQGPNSLEPAWSGELLVYPNPNEGSVQVIATETVSSYVLRDLQGRVIKTFPGSSTVLNLRAYPSGLYIVQALAGDLVVAQRLIERK